MEIEWQKRLHNSHFTWFRGVPQKAEEEQQMKEAIKKWLRSRQTAALVLICVLLLVLMLTALHMLMNYTQDELYRESQNQLSEITTQIYEKMQVTFERQWDRLSIMASRLSITDEVQEETLLLRLGNAQEQMSASQDSITLLAIDENGIAYGAKGKVNCTFANRLPESGQFNFLVEAERSVTAKMAFAEALEQPLTVKSDEGETRITHLVLLKDMDGLSDILRSSAFHQQNTTYIVETNGVQRYSDATTTDLTFLGNNIFPALRTLHYPHAETFDAILDKLDEQNGYICTDVMVDKNSYFLCIREQPGYDWLMLLFIPGDEVAVTTRTMVNSITLLISIGFGVLLLLTMGALFFLLKSMQNQEMAAAEAETTRKLSSANQELENARQAAMEALKMAETASVSKTSFLANMSHDIRTPMNAIIGLTSLMEHDLHNPDRMQAYIGKLRASSQYLLGLINDVLDMSKIESGASTLRVERINLAEQIELIESVIRPQAKEKGHHLIVHASCIHHENFLGDATRLRQVLLNILSNAVKYTPNGGEISFDVCEVSRSGHSYVKYSFTVQDNGIGMTEEFQEKIFDVFTRAEDSTTNKVQGTGLGMAITKSIVDMMGGVIHVQSAPGQGSRFEVLLDFKLDEEAEETARELSAMHLLLLGYPQGRVNDVLDVLQETSIQVNVVEQTQKAVAMLKKEDFDIVLLSCEHKSHEELLKTTRTLREAARKPIFIFCMQAAQREDVMETLSECELDGFVPLPFFLSNLDNEIRRLRTEAGRLAAQTTSVLSGVRLLCAEDNELNAEILETLLDMKGATCKIYPDGQQLLEAFDHVRPSDYDVILMDVQMPNLNGYDTTRAIRASDNPVGKKIPIIAMTANAFADDIQRSLDAGMDMHLSKPIDITELEKTLAVFRTTRTRKDGRAIFQRLQG